ncbi:MAG: polyprenyl diphosphate synthase [Nanoarchaeota archaeon]
MKLKHIAIILDGNRRWAKKKKLPAFEGHRRGFDKIKDLLAWCIELNIKQITLYCFSTENFGRKKKEINSLFSLFRKHFITFSKNEIIEKNKVRINIIGRISMFPKDMQKMMIDVMEKTKKNKKFQINLALGYGGRAEIIDSVKDILKDKKININNLSEKLISNHLYLADEPDVLIRPGGEKRLSNFLTWQSVYTELFFLDKFWPDFTKKDLRSCINDYKKRQRRLGC